MSELVEFRTEDGAVVVVETTDGPAAAGNLPVARDGGPPAQAARAVETFEGALAGVRAAAQSALRVFRDGTLRPDSVELEFGVKLTAEAGAIVAKGTAEGQLVVRLSWTASHDGPTPGTAAVPGQSTGPNRTASSTESTDGP